MAYLAEKRRSLSQPDFTLQFHNSEEEITGWERPDLNGQKQSNQNGQIGRTILILQIELIEQFQFIRLRYPADYSSLAKRMSFPIAVCHVSEESTIEN
jgi:hypothetical protein